MLYVDTGIGYAGGQVALIEVLKHLDQGRVWPVVASPPESRLHLKCAELDIAWLPLPAKSIHLLDRQRGSWTAVFKDVTSSMYSVAYLAVMIRRHKIDVVHANTFKGALVAAIACRFSRRPLVFHDRIHVAHGVLGKAVALMADRIVVVSQAVGSKHRGRAARKSRLVYDGIDVDRFSPASEQPAGMKVGFLGRITEEKGLLTLVECAGAVVTEVPDVRFLVGGEPFTRADASYLNDVKARIAALGLEDRFEFSGYVDDIRTLLAKVKVLALPSKNEGLGLAVLEAMAMGKPVVSFDIGGPRETITHGITGILIPPGDIGGFAGALASLLGDGDLARRMGEKGRERVVSDFSSRTTARRLEQVYPEVSPRPSPRRRIGYAIAAALVRGLFPLSRRCDLPSVRKILVIGGGGIGDVIMKIPVFAHLRKRFPAAEIVFFTSPGPSYEMVRGRPDIDRIITLEGREAMGLGGLRQTLACLRRLRRERFDMTITTHYGISFRGALFSYLLGAPIRVGFDRAGRGLLYNLRVRVANPQGRHAVDWNLDLARALGIKVAKAELSIALSPEDRVFASAFLRERNAGEDALLVGIFPGSKRISRLWPGGRFAEVADRLSDLYRCRIMLIGGEREREAIGEIRSKMRHEPILAVGQGIRETAALIERCGLMISTDSGPMHIAAAVKTPVVALFGPETPVRVRPYSERAAVVRHDVPCSPCHDYGCKLGTMACMDAITVDDVLAAVEANSPAWGLDRWRRASGPLEPLSA